MKTHRLVLVVLSMLLALAATATAAESIGYFEAIEKEAPIKAGETYYMRHCLTYEKDNWEATNYWRGVLLPINTQVRVETIGGKSMTISWGGTTLKIENNNYTKINMASLAKRMLSRTRVPIEQFGEATAASIAGGVLRLGMTREQAIMTRGYPPAHKTPSVMTDNGKWIYWSSRFVVVTYVFKDGKLSEGRDL